MSDKPKEKYRPIKERSYWELKYEWWLARYELLKMRHELLKIRAMSWYPHIKVKSNQSDKE